MTDNSSSRLFVREGDSAGAHLAAEIEAVKARLRALLPELRKLPGCPEGSDEDILAMSLPPYYTACPNPFIKEWLNLLPKRNESLVKDPGPFSADISEGKENAFYKAHSYPTKVPHPAIMRFILHYTEPGDVVFDGFAGTGMTGVAAQCCEDPDEETKKLIENELGSDAIRWGKRYAILGDLEPNATHISAGVNLPISAEAFAVEATKLIEKFENEYGWMYKTRLKGEDGTYRDVDIDYVVWSETFTCPHCGGEVVFYSAAYDPITKHVLATFNCPSCGAALTKDALERRFIRVRTLAGDTIDRIEFRPVIIAWRSGAKKGTKEVEAHDLQVIESIKGLRLSKFPTNTLPIESMVHGSRLKPKGFTCIHHLWSDRALATLSILWNWIEDIEDAQTKLAMKFWIEQGFWGFSWMNRFVPTHFSHVNQFLSGVYYIPSLHAEPSVRYNLIGTKPNQGKQASLAKLWQNSPTQYGNVMITTSSSSKLPIPDKCVDYIFTDPPFGKNIPYSDLALLIEKWHGVAS